VFPAEKHPRNHATRVKQASRDYRRTLQRTPGLNLDAHELEAAVKEFSLKSGPQYLSGKDKPNQRHARNKHHEQEQG
jgi:hypothetical protein